MRHCGIFFKFCVKWGTTDFSKIMKIEKFVKNQPDLSFEPDPRFELAIKTTF